MLDGLALLGIGWLIANRDKNETSGRSEEPSEPSEPSGPPRPVTPTGDDYRVELVATGEQNNIYLLQTRRGVLYDDGSGGYSWEDTGFLRGDFPNGFVMGSASVGGTITFTINSIRYQNVVVYSSKQSALDDDIIPEDDPSGPQQQPEDDEDDDSGDLPSLPPLMPPMGGFDSWVSTSGFGGV